MSFSVIEVEVLRLLAVKKLIDSMVNNASVQILGDDPDVEVHFKPPQDEHKTLFYIFLVDFLSCTDKRTHAPIPSTSYLGALREVMTNPSFDCNNSVRPLCEATRLFSEWLETEAEIPNFWLGSIEIERTLRIRRADFIKMSGDICKHSLLRLGAVAERLSEILTDQHRAPVTPDRALLALGDFQEWFHEDILWYHTSTIAEFLNNIRWGIYEYLKPTWEGSCVLRRDGNLPTCSYKYPTGVDSQIGRQWFESLMYEISEAPYIRRFEVAKYLKGQY